MPRSETRCIQVFQLHEWQGLELLELLEGVGRLLHQGFWLDLVKAPYSPTRATMNFDDAKLRQHFHYPI